MSGRASEIQVKWIPLFFLFTLLGHKPHCQFNLAQSSMMSFSKLDYEAGTQNWNITQDKQGRIYVANNEGLLVYDGARWQGFTLPNHTIVRSIHFGADGKLYVGGQDEFGYFQADGRGHLKFHSLLTLLPEEDRQFADVWSVTSGSGGLLFRTNSRLFHFRDNRITVYHAWSSWEFTGQIGNVTIAQDKQQGVLVLKSGHWAPAEWGKGLPSGARLTSVSSFGNTILITTLNHGVFKVNEDRITSLTVGGPSLQSNPVFTCQQVLPNGNILLGTYDDGVIYSDSNGNILQTFTKESGLLVNDVKCLFLDKQQNIWVGLDQGISFLNWNEAVKQIKPIEFNGAPGYSAVVFNQSLYFALANGVYRIPYKPNTDISSNQAKPIKIAKGLSWTFSLANGHLLVGRDDGLFEIKNDQLVPLDQQTGYWKAEVITQPVSGPAMVASGNYHGFALFSSDTDGFKKNGNFPSLTASSRFLAFDNRDTSIWVSHPYRGVYNASIKKQSVKLYTAKDGLPSDLDNHVFKINNQVIVATSNGIYSFDKGSAKFEQSQVYQKIFNGNPLRYLQDDQYGNLWFVSGKNLGVYDKQVQVKVYFPEVHNRILSGFESVYPIDSANILVGSDDGFFHINYENYKKSNQKPTVFISQVMLTSDADSVLYGGFGTAGNALVNSDNLHFRSNSFRFEFASSTYGSSGKKLYRYQLENFDNNWSDWSYYTFKDYTKIPPGDYRFRVVSKNSLGIESEEASYSFHISPAWYASIVAKIFYTLAIVFGLFIAWKLQLRRIQLRQVLRLEKERQQFLAEQQQREQVHQLEIEKSEKEMIKLKNEKLEAEIEFKNADLAASAMNLVQKKEFLVKFKEELNRLKQGAAPGAENAIKASDINKLLRSLSEQVNSGDEWEQFSMLFNKQHRDYLLTLKDKYPNLTAHELKLCAYLRMNLSSKEIAHLMSISVRGVEISRYRLRKKLEVPPKEDLFQFLLQIDLNAGTQS